MNHSPLIVETAMEIALPYETLNEMAKKFGAAKAREGAMSTSVGGIGPLLRERIFGQAEAGIDVIGVSLLYEYVWVQTWQDWGQIILEKRKIGNELRQILKATDLGFSLRLFNGDTVSVDVYELSYDKAKVYFLSCPNVTDVIYPGPKDMPAHTTNPHAWAHEHRLKQSWLIGRGALALSKKLNRRPDVVVLSETPTLFGFNRIVADEFQNDEFFSNTKYVFNDHTPLEYAHPIWDQHTLNMIKVDRKLYENIPAWNPQKKTLDVTSFLVRYCDAVYGVARKHGVVMRAMQSLQNYAEKIQYITNGVRLKDWQSSEFHAADQLSDQELIRIKQEKRKLLVDWAWRRFRMWPNWAAEAAQMKIVIWTRRITPYKRLDVLFKMVRQKDLRERFLKLNVILFVGGRVHQQDNHAQDIVYELLDLLEKDKELANRIVFADNFNVWEAPYFMQGTDAAIMLADDTREASATGFMKAQMNGGAILATSDGAIPEFVWFYGDAKSNSSAPSPNGFFVPYINGEPTPQGLLEGLEMFDKVYQDPQKRAAVIRSALAVTASVDVARTVTEMADLYTQLLSASPVS